MFWEVCVSKDLLLLVQAGTPNEDELKEAWGNINIEYADIISKETKRKVKDEHRIQVLQTKSVFVGTVLNLIDVARQYNLSPDQEQDQEAMCEALNKLFPSVKLDYSKKDELVAKLKRVEAMAKNWTVEINRLAAGHKSKKEDDKEEAATYQECFNMLAAINEYRKTSFQADKLTVLEFATYFKRMADELEARNNGKRNH